MTSKGHGEHPDPAAWGLPDFSFVPLAQGARNRVLRGTGVGANHVFKTTTRSEAQLGWLNRHVGALSPALALYVVPQPSLSGTLAVGGWTCEPFLPGTRLRAKDARTLDAAVTELHELGRCVPQRPGFATARELIHQSRGGDVDLSTMPAELVARCRAAWGEVPETSCLIHADLSHANMALSPDGKVIMYDWDEARRDHPLFDLSVIGDVTCPVAIRAALAYEIATCWHIEPERARALAPTL